MSAASGRVWLAHLAAARALTQVSLDQELEDGDWRTPLFADQTFCPDCGTRLANDPKGVLYACPMCEDGVVAS